MTNKPKHLIKEKILQNSNITILYYFSSYTLISFIKLYSILCQVINTDLLGLGLGGNLRGGVIGIIELATWCAGFPVPGLPHSRTWFTGLPTTHVVIQ